MKKVIGYLKTGSLACLVLMLITSCHSSRKVVGIESGWDLLSSHKVDFVSDRDKIMIDNNTPYTAIRFRVEDRPIHISELSIYFRNGDRLQPAIDDNVEANQESRIIQFDREGRNIDRIEFKYRTVGNVLKGRANVLVYGRRLDSDRFNNGR
jgi:hypothetical protein